jgi:hypothetical protein
MSEDKKVVVESKLSLSEEMHLGFLQSIAKTNYIILKGIKG